MKRSKNDHIRSTISRYFKRRQFVESEMPARKDAQREQSVTDMSVRRRTRSRTSVENSLALTSISGDATACDQQFTRMKAFILGASAPYHTELQPLLFPLFAHTYLEMLSNGQKVPAQKFHERHSETFKEEQYQSFIKVLKKLEAKSDVLTTKEVIEFREHRFILNLSEESFHYMMLHLKAEDNMIMLQIFNQYIKINVVQDAGAVCGSKLEMKQLPDVLAESQLIKESPASVAPVIDGQQQEPTLEDELAVAIKAVRELPPCLPSICFFTFLNTYQGLCSSTISIDKKRLSGCFEDSSILVWNLEPDLLTRTTSECDVSKIVLAADYIHCLEDEIKDKVFSRSTQSTETAKLVGHRGPVYKSRFLSDSKTYLLSCSEDSTIRLWNLGTQTNASLYVGHSSAVWDVNISSTDTWFASCSHDTTAKLWTFERTYPLRSYIGHTFDVDCLDFHPNNNYLATGSGDKTVRFWSVSEGRTVRLLQGHRGSVLALAFSPNGKLLASAGEDRRIRVWDLGSGQVLKDLRGHSDTVFALAFDDTSSILASGGADCCVRLWDIQKTTDSQQIEGHSSPELLGAFPTKSALLSYLRFAPYNILLAAGASS
ncbi:TAF5-like RNA polymerase II p300/CBP-associated factor-associated factor 65 kDa subunit 5L [Biomphalaria glabrata]|uniref:TAF5-like RNA polymerase II p300/CBP-associated factor-associated factor 65 kDa subunit 5L isoform X1 n=2 Tax=Biomphalaria glabrata TaxID=6526 RepID=A0A9W2Z7Q2_BIOGL|nr:TAF5-like RNA polymerase II p300/CBP-associated factor-associated factor 65 kDa subunit 5L isoform X1 [Biomphalaria glabrata]KAI8737191.1 TAF5-like RNA polymerase II p300/CBP-associated factor [Biomphalaria glabrata]